MELIFGKWHFLSSRRPLVAAALALVLITVACGQEHQVPVGPTGTESPPPLFPSTELPPSACAFSSVRAAIPFGSGLNAIYRGHSPFALELSPDGEAHTVCLEIERQGETVAGDWYAQGSCCEGGAVNGTFVAAGENDTLGKLKLRLASVDYDLGLDAAVTSADGSSFSGEIFMCQNDDCSERRPTGPVTFIRQ
jgi:hypothetical protein